MNLCDAIILYVIILVLIVSLLACFTTIKLRSCVALGFLLGLFFIYAFLPFSQVIKSRMDWFLMAYGVILLVSFSYLSLYILSMSACDT
jgi:hypothetical protein